ncbi:thioesterase family protein [Virgibacillus kekensis]|uniref:Thioesterase family protein n=1 Tax=Virgibacillus kekensis TaxID=202261 RepID=A0ABV9DIL0_9BACI
MKKGLHIGSTASINVEVTRDMFAQFDEEVVHPTYSTVSMVYHMELVSRKLLLPYLETDEEGMGASVTVKHIAPSGLGSTIDVTATVLKVDERAVVTEVLLKNEHGIIGKGEVKQAVIPKKVINERIGS